MDRTSRTHSSLLLIVALVFVFSAGAADELVTAVHQGDAKLIRSLLAQQPHLDAVDEDGNTALHWAALNGDADLVKTLLKRGASSGITNRAGATPLLYAVGNMEAVKSLIAAGGDRTVNIASKFSTTPLVAAARYPQSSAVVQLLMRHGVDARSKTNALRESAAAGDLESFKMLLATGVRPHDVVEPAMMGYREIVEAAVDAGADLQYDRGHAGHALNFALYGHQPAIAKFLIQRGADLRFRSPRGEHQTPPILWAAYSETGDASVAQAMIEKGADVNMLSVLGESALDWARARNNRALEHVLLEAGARGGSGVRKQKEIPNRELPGESTALNQLVRQSAARSVALLQRSSDAFLRSGVVRQQKCVSCHQQTLPAVALGWARRRGLPIDETSVARQVQDQIRFWKQGDKIQRTYEMLRPQPDTSVLLGYGLWGLFELGHPADSLTEAMVWYLAATQRPDGSWPAADFRPPMEDGPIQGTAFAIRIFRIYPLAGREKEVARRIERARNFLSAAHPATFNQQVFQLLGLGWSGEKPSQLRPFVQRILARQQADGGWAPLDGLPGDSWATGQALVALNMVGGIRTSHDAYQKGIHFLLRTQFDDGSWYVRSRSWPFQPHFESEFPHGKDQWISAGGTAWAAMALLLTQPEQAPSGSPRDWMAIKISDERPSAAEPKLKPVPPADGTHTVDFNRDIQPLLDRSCAACHRGDKRKGGFSMASRESMIKGGNSGEPALRPGDSAASRVMRMVTDQVEDLEMPPRGKRKDYPALTANEVRLLRTWIDEGAEWIK